MKHSFSASASESLTRLSLYPRRRSVTLVFALFLFGIFVDYGGAFGIKIICSLLTLGWVFLCRKSLAILYQRRMDFIILVGVPTLLSLIHLLLSFSEVDIRLYGARFYNTISSPLLLLLFPLFYYVGSRKAMRLMSLGFRLVALAILLVFALQVANVIRLDDYTGIAQTYRIGFIGVDQRLPDVSTNQQGVLAPAIAFAMPLIFGYELATSVIGTILLFLSLLVVGSRGLTLGVALIAVLWLFVLIQKRQRKRILLKIGVFAGIVSAVLILNEPLRFRLTGVVLKRTAVLGQDLSTQARFGHLEGYYNSVAAEPMRLFVGMGPDGYIDNAWYGELFGDSRVSTTEISVLNLAIYYGLPYALLYTLWLYRGAWRLWRLRKLPGFQKSDFGLVIGVVVFWITGNTNPQMTGPFAIMAYMLVVVRIAELKQIQTLLQPAQA
jgi:hypothetical protein